MFASGRYCCKSLFALVIKNSPGCRRDFRVKMWGTSSPDDKLTSDLGSVIETTQIGGRRSDRLMAGKLSPGNFGLLQQYRHSVERLASRPGNLQSLLYALTWCGLISHRHPLMELLFVCLAVHDLEFGRWTGVDRRICQTFAASPAEPGELPLGFSSKPTACMSVMISSLNMA
jgi:hypothetical protein